MANLNFYDVDKSYVSYLKNEEIKARGFTCVPDMVYQGEQKFLCGIVLEVDKYEYYVPVSSYKKKQSENILIVFPNDKINPVKGSLRFNYMFPVPNNAITPRIIKNEPNIKRRMFLNAQLQFCINNSSKIQNQAIRTYTKVTKKLNKFLLSNSCDFKLLETVCDKYNSI